MTSADPIRQGHPDYPDSHRHGRRGAGEAGAFVKMRTPGGARWAWRGTDATLLLPPDVGLASLLLAPSGRLEQMIGDGEDAAPGFGDGLLAPVDPDTEVWAAGVTYERSRQARIAESSEPDIYQRVYQARRPELFFKSVGWRVRGPGQSISIRADSTWDVPEPELAAVLRPDGSVFGWTICNDVSSRSIEGENPLYLPQAKVYLGGCALGPAIVPAGAVADPYALTIRLRIERNGEVIWSGDASTAQLRRRVDELAAALLVADVFPRGVVLSTGTSLVPDEPFTLQADDVVRIGIDRLGELVNAVVAGLPDLTVTDGRAAVDPAGR